MSATQARLRMAGTSVTVEELAKQVKRELPFFKSSGGGATLSGGEPAMQHEFSYRLFLALKQQGIHTSLETTGCASWEVMSRLAEVTDLFLYDLKLIDSELHQHYTKVPNNMILQNLSKLAALGNDIQVRVPCIPGINDSEEQIQSVVRFVNGLGIRRMALLPYNSAAGAKYQWIDRPYPLSDKVTQSSEYMNLLAGLCRAEGLQVQIGG